MKLPQSYILQKFYQYAGYPKFNRGTKTYIAGCPTCKEGSSWGRKRRLYYLVQEDYIYCHNCNKSWKPLNWIIEQSKMSFREVLEEAKEFDNTDVLIEKLENKKPIQISTLPEDSINLFDEQQVKYYRDNRVTQDALAFITKRRLNTAVNKVSALYISLKDFIHKNRLCIPFYDINNKITFYQTRAIYKKDEIEKPKYLSKLNADKTIFGLRNIKPELDYLFIFEGPIDAMFCQNGLAMGGIHISELQQKQLNQYRLMNKIWILDNQLENTDVRDKIIKLIDNKERVFIWPSKYKEFKDVNEICQKYQLDQISPKFFIDNSYSGIEALMRVKN